MSIFCPVQDASMFGIDGHLQSPNNLHAILSQRETGYIEGSSFFLDNYNNLTISSNLHSPRLIPW